MKNSQSVQTYAGGKRVMVLCPSGHVILTLATAEYAGSEIEARLGTEGIRCGCEVPA